MTRKMVKEKIKVKGFFRLTCTSTRFSRTASGRERSATSTATRSINRSTTSIINSHPEEVRIRNSHSFIMNKAKNDHHLRLRLSSKNIKSELCKGNCHPFAGPPRGYREQPQQKAAARPANEDHISYPIYPAKRTPSRTPSIAAPSSPSIIVPSAPVPDDQPPPPYESLEQQQNAENEERE